MSISSTATILGVAANKDFRIIALTGDLWNHLRQVTSNMVTFLQKKFVIVKFAITLDNTVSLETKMPNKTLLAKIRPA